MSHVFKCNIWTRWHSGNMLLFLDVLSSLGSKWSPMLANWPFLLLIDSPQIVNINLFFFISHCRLNLFILLHLQKKLFGIRRVLLNLFNMFILLYKLLIPNFVKFELIFFNKLLASLDRIWIYRHRNRTHLKMVGNWASFRTDISICIIHLFYWALAWRFYPFSAFNFVNEF